MSSAALCTLTAPSHISARVSKQISCSEPSNSFLYLQMLRQDQVSPLKVFVSFEHM